MAMATSKMVTPAFPAPDKQRCADPDTNEFSCDEMICSEFNMMMGGALRASTRGSWVCVPAAMATWGAHSALRRRKS